MVVRLRLRKVADRDTVTAGWIISYTIRVSNDSASALSQIIVTDTLPANTVFVSATTGYVRSGSRLTWRLNNVPAGATRTLGVQIRTYSTTRGILANTASASAGGVSVSVQELVGVVAP